MSLALLSQSAGTPVERVSPSIAAERVSRCGLGEVAIEYDEDMQSELLIAAGAASATDEQLACADEAAGYYYLLLPPDIQRRYHALRGARWSAQALIEARAWLGERGLLERVPKYEAGVTDDASFTRQLEELCGPRAKGAFQSEHGFHTLSPDWLHENSGAFEGYPEVLACLMHATQVAGYEIGFIGNEAGLDRD